MSRQIQITVHLAPKSKSTEVRPVREYLMSVANNVTLNPAVEAADLTEIGETVYTDGSPKTEGAAWDKA